MASTRLTVVVAALLIAAVAAVAVAGSAAPTYNVSAAMAFLNAQGCVNASITNCPGNRLCTDAEFYARALAAGGAIALDPNTPLQQPFVNYTFNGTGYNLCIGPGLISFLKAAGFTAQKPTQNIPAGAIVFTRMWYPGMPFFSNGNGRCSSHTPIVAGGPHCNVSCAYFIPRVVYAFPSA